MQAPTRVHANPRCKFEKTCGLESRKFLRRSQGQVDGHRTPCIMVMQDSRKSFRDPGVKKHNFFVQTVYVFENLHPLKTAEHQGRIIPTHLKKLSQIGSFFANRDEN